MVTRISWPATEDEATEDEMKPRMRTYTAYSIYVVFGGFVIGWLSATIARYVYPPPKKYRQDAGNAR